MDSLSHRTRFMNQFCDLSLSLSLRKGKERKSHVNVTFALVSLKRLNSVKVCDKMCFKFSEGEGPLQRGWKGIMCVA